MMAELEKDRLKNDFSFFVREAWPIIEPKEKLAWSWHYDYICEWLNFVSSGDFKLEYPEKEGIIINVPPRTGKSIFITICWPVWTWLKHPERRFLCASYSGKLAMDHHAKRRFLIHSEWFRSRFGDCFEILKDQADDFRNDRTGYFIAASVGGSGTGFGGDICIGDDLLSAKEAHSKAMRETTNNWLDSTFSTRLNNRVTGCYVYISQRLADDDPTGYLISKYPDRYIHLVVEREALTDQTYSFPVSGQLYNRTKGDILQPTRCPPIVLEGLKKKSREWAGQEQQQPAPEGGVIFQSDWWRFYELNDPLPSFDVVILSVDCAFKGHSDSDYVAIQKWGMIGPRFYLLERQTEHLKFVATMTAIRAMAMHDASCPYCRGLRPTAIIVEDAANGPAVIDSMRRSSFGRWPDGTPIYIPLIAIQPQGGKEARAYAASAEFEAGNVYGCQEMPGWPMYLHAMSHYAGEGSIPHDDDIDSTSQAVIWRSRRVMGLDEYFRRQQIAAERQHKGLEPPTIEAKQITAVGNGGKKIRWDSVHQIWLDVDTKLPLSAG
jgi:predicted phage terminase large subunit-like protein